MDPRRELSLINKHVRHRNREAGESIVWFEFSPFQGGYSTYDDVYDEGVPGSGGRTYKSGVVVPTIYVTEAEDAYRAIPEGRLTTQNVSATMLFKDLVACGISSPESYERHLNDMFLYDSKYYRINRYVAKGRLPEEVVVTIDGFEIYIDQEMPFDNGPQHRDISTLPWPASLP